MKIPAIHPNLAYFCAAVLSLTALVHPMHAQNVTSGVWLFDDPDQLGLDSSGNGHNFALGGTGISGTDGGIALPKSGIYGLYSNTGNGVNTDLSTNILTSFTFTLDMKASASVNPILIRRGSSASTHGGFYIQLVSNTLRLFSWDPDTNTNASAVSASMGTLPTDTFTQLSVVYNAGSVSFYKNGQLFSSKTAIAGADTLDFIPAATTADYLSIGQGVTTANVYYDNVGFFENRAMTSDQISSIYNDGLVNFLGIPEPSTVAMLLGGGVLLAGGVISKRRRATLS